MERYQYYAFISYSRKDEYWAKWLHKKLERYKLPSIIRKEYEGQVPDKIRPVFLDKTDIGLGSLKTNLTKELADSRYLIVICSPDAAQSEWVNTEVEHFISMGREDMIVPFIVAGSPVPEGAAVQCYPLSLSKLILGASVAELGKEKAFIKTVSRLLGLRFDELWNRTERERKRHFITKVTFAVVLLVSVLFFGYKFYDNYLQKKEARKNAIIAKANDLVNNGKRLEIDDPGKALMLYANAYYLNPADSFFSILESFYERRTNAFADYADSAKEMAGTLNLFPKMISLPFEYDTDSELLDDIGIEYDTDDLVKYSLKRKLILTLDHNRVLVYNWASQTRTVINMDSLNILNWDYNDFNNTVILYCADKSGDKEDVFVYRLDTSKLESLYQNVVSRDGRDVLAYFLDNKGQNIGDTANFMKNEFETGLRIFPVTSGPYFIFYNTSHLIGNKNSGIRKFGVINVNDPGLNWMLSLTGDVNYHMKKVISVSPDGMFIIIEFRNVSEPAKVISFFPEENVQMPLVQTNAVINRIPETVSWIMSGDKEYCIMGNEDGLIQIKDPFSLTDFSLFNYQVDNPPGSITAIANNDKYIIAGTSEGYILAWQNEIDKWLVKDPHMVYNVSSFRVSKGPIEEIQVNADTLLFRDATNAVSMCKLSEKVKLSKKVDELRKQFESMNLNSLSKQDSLGFGLIEK
jgi:TIR domain